MHMSEYEIVRSSYQWLSLENTAQNERYLIHVFKLWYNKLYI